MLKILISASLALATTAHAGQVVKNNVVIQYDESEKAIVNTCMARQVETLTEALTPETFEKLGKLGLHAITVSAVDGRLLIGDIAWGIDGGNAEIYPDDHIPVLQPDQSLKVFTGALEIEARLSSDWFGIDGSRHCVVASKKQIIGLLDRALKALTEYNKSQAEAAAAAAKAWQTLEALGKPGPTAAPANNSSQIECDAAPKQVERKHHAFEDEGCKDPDAKGKSSAN